MNLKLERPIVFFDLETTGLDVKTAKIVQIAMVKIHEDGTREVKEKKFNPEVPIPKEASDVHGITDEMVANLPSFKFFAKGLHSFIENCDLGGFNSNRYDVPILFNELERCGIMLDYMNINLIDVGNLAKILNPRTLSATYKLYTGEELTDAHNAIADIEATVMVAEKMLDSHAEIPHTASELALYSNHGNQIVDLGGVFTSDPDGNIRFANGKHKGEIARDHKDYLSWMVGPKASFGKDTVLIALTLLQKNDW